MCTCNQGGVWDDVVSVTCGHFCNAYDAALKRIDLARNCGMRGL